MSKSILSLYSIFAWIFIGFGTAVLFLTTLFILWPVSVLFHRAEGGLPHRVAQFWARMIVRVLPFWEIRTEGLERIEKGKAYVVVSNHQSLVDILVVLARLPLHFKFIAKRELFWIPFFGWHLWLARYIPLRRGDPLSGKKCLEKAAAWLKRGVSVLFFPEGTRSPDGNIHDFKIGAFKTAVEQNKDLLPMVIAGTREAIPKHSWAVEKRAKISLKILAPLSAKEIRNADIAELRTRVRDRIVSEFASLGGRISASHCEETYPSS